MMYDDTDDSPMPYDELKRLSWYDWQSQRSSVLSVIENNSTLRNSWNNASEDVVRRITGTNSAPIDGMPTLDFIPLRKSKSHAFIDDATCLLGQEYDPPKAPHVYTLPKPPNSRPYLSIEQAFSGLKLELKSYDGIFESSSQRSNPLCYQKNGVARPILNLPSHLHRSAVNCFKLINKTMDLEAIADAYLTAAAVLDYAVKYEGLRDEILIQLCKQLTKNPDSYL
jgi:hypothetical protein